MVDFGDLIEYLAYILVVVGGFAWFYVGVTTASPDLLPYVPALVERTAYIFVGIGAVLDFLGITGGYGLFSDDRSMM